MSHLGEGLHSFIQIGEARIPGLTHVKAIEDLLDHDCDFKKSEDMVVSDVRHVTPAARGI